MLRKGGADNGDGFLSADRAQSVVIGTILVFALLVTVFAVIQTTIIPSSNADAEAEHSQLTRGQLQDLRNDIQRSANTGEGYSQAFKPGVNYPLRTFFLNPGPTAGTIQTRGTDDDSVEITITNARALDSETRQYLDGGEESFSTGAVVYNPAYNEYRNAPERVVIEQSFVYSEFENTKIIDSSQRVVEGRDISLTALDGDLSRSQREQFTIDTTALSPGVRTVSVENDGDPIRITISTQLSQDTLIEDVFSSEIDDNGGPPTDDDDDGEITCDEIDSGADDNDRYIKNCDFTDGGEFNTFTLIFEEDTTYNLEMARVSVGPGGEDPGPYYITKVEGSTSSLPDTGEREFVYEVRDRYNNPVSGVSVPVTANQGTFENGNPTITRTTNEEGRISVTYNPNGIPENSTESETITAGTDLNDDGDTDDREEVESTITIIDTIQDNDLAASFNPASPITLIESETSGTISGGGGEGGGSITCGDNDNECYVTMELENTGDQTWVFDQVRYQFYIAPVSPGAGSREAPPETVTIQDDVTCSTGSYDFQDPLSGEEADADFGALGSEDTTMLYLDFDQSSGNFASVEGDGFIISIQYHEQGEPDNTTTLTYFVSPRAGPSANNNPCTGGGG